MTGLSQEKNIISVTYKMHVLRRMKMKVKRHKTMQEVKKILGKSEVIEEEKCPQCGGITVTNYGPGISCTFCVDCDYNDYDYDL